MKLQVGCSAVRGKYKQAEWVNLDIVYQAGTNVVADGLKMPFPDNTFDEIHCIHVLEHMTRDKYPFMLKEMRRVVRPGCPVYVETPDFKRTIEMLHNAFNRDKDATAVHIWTTSVYGKSERPGMSHHWGFYEGLLMGAFREAGFTSRECLWKTDNMISKHFRQEPVLLVRGSK